jgi:hypothetical protein
MRFLKSTPIDCGTKFWLMDVDLTGGVVPPLIANLPVDPTELKIHTWPIWFS